MATKRTSSKKTNVDPIVEATEAEQARINAIPHDPRLDDLPSDTALLMRIDDKLGQIVELLQGTLRVEKRGLKLDSPWWDRFLSKD